MPDARLVQGLLAHEHYLGARNSAGENIRYLCATGSGVQPPARCLVRRRGSAPTATPSLVVAL
jgi:hypothetical protein